MIQETFTISPVGYVRRRDGKTLLEILPQYRLALDGLERFGHVQVLWWVSGFQSDEHRRTLQGQPPYDAPVCGVFALRSPMRPNPIALTTARILAVNHAEGLVEVAAFDAFDDTPIIDLKAYFPVADRVKEPIVPPWVEDWPQWVPDEDEAPSTDCVNP